MQKTPVSILQELIAGKKLACPEYELNGAGQPHCMSFTCRVIVNNETASGVGSTKRDAKQNAAKNMLKKFGINLETNQSAIESDPTTTPNPEIIQENKYLKETLKKVQNEKEILEFRISELYKTAHAELNRKDIRLNELLHEKEEVFKKENITNTPFNNHPSRERSKSPFNENVITYNVMTQGSSNSTDIHKSPYPESFSKNKDSGHVKDRFDLKSSREKDTRRSRSLPYDRDKKRSIRRSRSTSRKRLKRCSERDDARFKRRIHRDRSNLSSTETDERQFTNKAKAPIKKDKYEIVISHHRKNKSKRSFNVRRLQNRDEKFRSRDFGQPGSEALRVRQGEDRISDKDKHETLDKTEGVMNNQSDHSDLDELRLHLSGDSDLNSENDDHKKKRDEISSELLKFGDKDVEMITDIGLDFQNIKSEDQKNLNSSPVVQLKKGKKEERSRKEGKENKSYEFTNNPDAIQHLTEESMKNTYEEKTRRHQKDDTLHTSNTVRIHDSLQEEKGVKCNKETVNTLFELMQLKNLIKRRDQEESDKHSSSTLGVVSGKGGNENQLTLLRNEEKEIENVTEKKMERISWLSYKSRAKSNDVRIDTIDSKDSDRAAISSENNESETNGSKKCGEENTNIKLHSNENLSVKSNDMPINRLPEAGEHIQQNYNIQGINEIQPNLKRENVTSSKVESYNKIIILSNITIPSPRYAKLRDFFACINKKYSLEDLAKVLIAINGERQSYTPPHPKTLENNLGGNDDLKESRNKKCLFKCADAVCLEETVKPLSNNLGTKNRNSYTPPYPKMPENNLEGNVDLKESRNTKSLLKIADSVCLEETVKPLTTNLETNYCSSNAKGTLKQRDKANRNIIIQSEKYKLDNINFQIRDKNEEAYRNNINMEVIKEEVKSKSEGKQKMVAMISSEKCKQLKKVDDKIIEGLKNFCSNPTYIPNIRDTPKAVFESPNNYIQYRNEEMKKKIKRKLVEDTSSTKIKTKNVVQKCIGIGEKIQEEENVDVVKKEHNNLSEKSIGKNNMDDFLVEDKCRKIKNPQKLKRKSRNLKGDVEMVDKLVPKVKAKREIKTLRNKHGRSLDNETNKNLEENKTRNPSFKIKINPAKKRQKISTLDSDENSDSIEDPEKINQKEQTGKKVVSYIYNKKMRNKKASVVEEECLEDSRALENISMSKIKPKPVVKPKKRGRPRKVINTKCTNEEHDEKIIWTEMKNQTSKELEEEQRYSCGENVVSQIRITVDTDAKDILKKRESVEETSLTNMSNPSNASKGEPVKPIKRLTPTRIYDSTLSKEKEQTFKDLKAKREIFIEHPESLFNSNKVSRLSSDNDYYPPKKYQKVTCTESITTLEEGVVDNGAQTRIKVQETQLNLEVAPDSSPLPRIEQTYDALLRNTFLNKNDGNSSPSIKASNPQLQPTYEGLDIVVPAPENSLPLINLDTNDFTILEPLKEHTYKNLSDLSLSGNNMLFASIVGESNNRDPANFTVIKNEQSKFITPNSKQYHPSVTVSSTGANIVQSKAVSVVSSSSTVDNTVTTVGSLSSKNSNVSDNKTSSVMTSNVSSGSNIICKPYVKFSSPLKRDRRRRITVQIEDMD